MADTTFTEMGQALDAASQSRETSTSSVSSGGEPGNPAQDTGSSSEGPSTPVVTGGGGQPPKTDTSPSAREDTPGNPSSGGNDTRSPDDKDGAERRAHNKWFASQRMARKQEKQRRFEEQKARLERERDSYADKDGQNYNEQMALVKQDQLNELEMARIREAQEEWEREAYELFEPEDASAFIKDSKRYGDWINKREPELLSYLDRPYGKLMLKGWMDKIAKNAELADKWEALNSFEKYKIIDRYYNQLEKFGEDYAAGKVDINGNPIGQGAQQAPQAPNGQGDPKNQTQTQVQTPQVPNAPVPGSGRDTNTMPPSNNFALMLQDAMNKRRT